MLGLLGLARPVIAKLARLNMSAEVRKERATVHHGIHEKASLCQYLNL